MTTAVLYIVSGLMIGIAAYKLYTTIKKARLIAAAKTWPAVTAQVLKKEVVRRVSGKGQVNYFPELDYKYDVMGSEFNKHARLPKAWSGTHAQKTLDTIGETIEVRYNPENPQEHANGYEKAGVGDYLLVVFLVLLGLAGFITQLL
jgi:hypothetical protein